MRFVLRRLLHGAVLLFSVSILTFLLTELAPGDFVDAMRIQPEVSEETVEAVKERLGLDRPLPIRYARWLGSVARGDLGFSLAYNQPVAPLLWPRARNTLLLSLLATALAWALALPAGIWAAERRGRPAAAAANLGVSLLLSVPHLVIALVLVLVAHRTGWFPTGGMVSPGFDELGLAGQLRDLAAHLALPVTALSLAMFPALFRHVQAAMGEVLGSPFLRAVRGFGIPRRRRLLRYALPVAANPLINLFGLSVGSLLSASVLVEYIMGWPGIGHFLLQAILDRDVYVVIGTVMISTVFLLFGNLVADVMLYAVDPRIRRES